MKAGGEMANGMERVAKLNQIKHIILEIGKMMNRQDTVNTFIHMEPSIKETF